METGEKLPFPDAEQEHEKRKENIMKKRVVSLLLCLIMALSLIPTVAFAAEVNTPTTDADKTTNGAYGATGKWAAADNGGSITKDGLTLSKTAKPVPGKDNTYEITLSVVTSQTTTTTTTSSDAATVLVIDTSGSMAWCTKNHRHDENCYSKEECNTETNPTHWETVTILGHQYSYHKEFDDNWNRFPCRYSWKDDKYYKVENNCGQGAHNHDNARGGEWCKNKDLNSDTDSRIANAKAAAKAFLDSYKDTSSTPAARWVAIVSFADNATSSNWFNVSTSEGDNAARSAIDNLHANGGTNLDAGLSAANTLMADNTISAVTKANKNVIALTDGAPTKSQKNGNGKYGSENINTDTNDTAEALKGNITGLYTICFAASNEVCYQGGPSVSDFLRDSIASTGKASTVDEGADLPTEFKSISNTITSGLTGDGWTVEDPMPDYISVVDGSTSPEFVLTDANSKTYTWKLTNATPTSNGNTTTYTYTTSYTVKIDPNGKDANGTSFNEKDFYPTNNVTKLHYKNESGVDSVAYFPVPGVKVKLSAPTDPETATLTINKTITGLDKAKDISFTVTGPNSYNQSITILANSFNKDANGNFTGSVTVPDLNIGQTYTVSENADSAKVDGYTLNTTTNPTNGKVNVTKEGTSVSFTNTYVKHTTAKITINKNVNVTGNTQPTATTMPTFQFVAKVDNTEVGKLSLTPKKDANGKWTASGDMTVSIPANLFVKDNVTVTISEVIGNLNYWTYDKNVKSLQIAKDGTKYSPVIVNSAAEVVPTDPIASFTFTNEYKYTYTPPARPSDPIRRQPTTTTTTKPVQSVKTGDMGIALYAVTSLLSLSGTALLIKKRKDEK